MKSVNGIMVRAFGCIGVDTIYNEGEASLFETHFNMVDTTSKEYSEDEDYFDREDLTYPDEDLVMLIAANWSIAPNNLEDRDDFEDGLGIIGRL